ncbi:MAG: sugar transferase [Candidatus Marinimicrobia bacterium]|nr:sugar transferase [Candidatus Neomarinimicrobiota bacterium]
MSKLFSLILLICLSPVFALVALAIIINDGFPIFFKQKRVGLNNVHFWIYKFRTMKKDAPDIATHLVKDSTSLYTSIGPFLRMFSFDELPQLINILKGDMVFIGPRPALYNQDDLNNLRTEAGVQVLTPGVTGWAQVNGRDELSIPDKVKMDIYYLENQSLWLDIKILFMTIFKVFKTEGVKK